MFQLFTSNVLVSINKLPIKRWLDRSCTSCCHVSYTYTHIYLLLSVMISHCVTTSSTPFDIFNTARVPDVLLSDWFQVSNVSLVSCINSSKSINITKLCFVF